MADDWDLLAVVRGCTATTSSSSFSTVATTTSATTSCSIGAHPPSSFQTHDNSFLFFPDPSEPTTSGQNEELDDLFKPFFPLSQPLTPHKPPISFSPLSVPGGVQDLSPPPPPPPQPPPPQQRQVENQKPKLPLIGARSMATSTTTTTTTTSSSHTPSPRSKRRKNQLKRVCQVPAEGLSSDTWSWRKYGQKPIKGSPYPRGYYRCSTSKGCLARKQVERSRSDPGMFIVTYTAEHNHPMPTHRNSLAGSTRQKPVTAETTAAGETSKPSSSPPVSQAGLSLATEKMESRKDRGEDIMGEEDGELSVSDMVISDDFFEGLEELTGQATVDSFSEDSPVSVPFPWQPRTTSAGGG